MRHSRAKKYCFILIAALAFAALPAWGDIIVSQQGATNPAVNGFSTDPFTASQGPVDNTAWNVQGEWCCAGLYYLLSGAQITDLNSATNWALTATFANLSTTTSPTYGYPGSYGSYANVSVNDVRFDLELTSDGSGNQVLWTDSFVATAPRYTIAGLGTNYATLEVLYSNSTHTADIFVNGTRVITGYAGDSTLYVGNDVEFGGENGNFSQVLLQTNPSSVPEPGSFLLLGSGFLGLAGMLRRKMNS